MLSGIAFGQVGYSLYRANFRNMYNIGCNTKFKEPPTTRIRHVLVTEVKLLSMNLTESCLLHLF